MTERLDCFVTSLLAMTNVLCPSLRGTKQSSVLIITELQNNVIGNGYYKNQTAGNDVEKRVRRKFVLNMYLCKKTCGSMAVVKIMLNTCLVVLFQRMVKQTLVIRS